MADWQVAPERIEIFPHPDADVINLQVARVGMFPLVINKSSGYKSGDIIIFAPKRTILPEDLRSHYVNPKTGESYLKHGTTVKSCRLKGVLSEGVVIPADYLEVKLRANDESKEYPELVGKKIEDLIGQDVSALLDMKEQMPDIKVVFGGDLARIRATHYSRHDVEGIHIFANEFKEGEECVATVKYHGSQINVIRHEDGFVELSSKGMIGKGAVLVESENNIYWKAWHNTGIEKIIDEHFPNDYVQVMGEVIPVQKGFTYGVDVNKPKIVLFRLEINGRRYSTAEVFNFDHKEELEFLTPFRQFWAKIVYVGPFDVKVLQQYAKGMEPISGRNLHVNEGVVVESKLPRLSSRGFFPLYLKVINPKYKGEEDDDAMS